MSRSVISVCVATYNQCALIETCLRSILDQEVDADIQVLVGDDASTDGTSEVIASLANEYGEQLKHFRRESNVGAFANMCDLIARANGDFIARVDGDDFWLPGKLAQQLDQLRANLDCVAIYTNAITIDDAGNRVGLFNDVGDICFGLAWILRHGNVLNNSSVLFRTEYRSSWIEPQVQIDYQVHLQLARYGTLLHIGTPLAAYRVNSICSMVTSNNARVRELYWQAIQSVPRDLVTDDDYAHGLADFLRRVFFRAVSTRNASLWREWKPRVFAASPYGAARMHWLTAANILRMLAREAFGRLRRDADGKRLRVLYRR